VDEKTERREDLHLPAPISPGAYSLWRYFVSSVTSMYLLPFARPDITSTLGVATRSDGLQAIQCPAVATALWAVSLASKRSYEADRPQAGGYNIYETAIEAMS